MPSFTLVCSKKLYGKVSENLTLPWSFGIIQLSDELLFTMQHLDRAFRFKAKLPTDVPLESKTTSRIFVTSDGTNGFTTETSDPSLKIRRSWGDSWGGQCDVTVRLSC